MKRLITPILSAIVVTACVTTDAPRGGLSLEVVGARADLVSGGDALVRVRTGSAGPVVMTGAEPPASLTLNGRPVLVAPVFRPGPPVADVLRPARLTPAPDGDGYLVLVQGLAEGRNEFSVSLGGRTARLTLTNHPNDGPLFSGPQIQPWPCLPGAVNAQCDRPAVITWSYMPTGDDAAFEAYNPDSPPVNVATTTTIDGVRVPFIVRVETFTQNRSEVRIATLFDPSKPWTPFQPQPQWNKGVYVLQGSGCGTGFGERAAGNPLNERALGQGFIVVTAALLHNTVNCNPVVQAETAIMAKEHVAETYGPFDIVFGQGSSGGAISQLMDQNAYPGIYDGIILNHLFADSDASRRAAYDCNLIAEALALPDAPAWTEAQREAVMGMLSGCASSPTRFNIYNPSVGTNCTVPDAQKFHPARNPTGVRCALQDYQINQVGRRADGYANGRLDTEGVQFGLNALLAGTITPAQFVHLNASIGGHDIDFNRLEARTVADRPGLRRLYETGIANTLSNLQDTAIIETRLSVTDFHQPFHADMVQARLMRAQGHTENYALWRTPSRTSANLNTQAFDTMVAWLRAIKADGRNVPKARKVIDNRPTLARDRCVVSGRDADASQCPRPPALARVLAGAPDTNDSGKCQLKPLRRGDHGPVVFTDAQWAALQRTFPTGVCDWSRPMIDYRETIPWLTYDGEGYRRLP